MLEKARRERHDWGAMEWLVEGAHKKISVARMTLDPLAVSSAHRHRNCEEAIHVLSRQIEQRRGNDWIKMSKGDTIFVGDGDVHQTRNIGNTAAELMIVYTAGERSYEEVSG